MSRSVRVFHASGASFVMVDIEQRLEGSHDNINVPAIHGTTVIDITNEHEEVEPFGKVPRKMTEPLIQENLERSEHFVRRMIMAGLTGLLLAERSKA